MPIEVGGTEPPEAGVVTIGAIGVTVVVSHGVTVHCEPSVMVVGNQT